MSCDEAVNAGITPESDIRFIYVYQSAHSCAAKTETGKSVMLQAPNLTPEGKKVMLMNILKTIPHYDERTLPDGLFTWIIYSDGSGKRKFVALQVKDSFEVATKHAVIALSSGAKSVHLAGELLKSGTNISFNLQSGTYAVKLILNKSCTSEELYEKVRKDFQSRFPGVRLTEVKSTLILRSMPVKLKDLEAYEKVGFTVELFDDSKACKEKQKKYFVGGRRTRRRRRV